MKSNTIRLLPVILSVVLFSCSDSTETTERDNAPAIKVVVSAPETRALQAIETSGTVAASDAAVISTRVMGFVTGIHVKKGDKVRRNQLLLSISNQDIQAKRAQARAMVAEAEAALVDAEKDLQRYTELYKEQSASEKELENITLRHESLKAKTEAARQMQREAEAMLNYTELRAPFDGVVTQKYIEEGSMANPGAPLLAVENISNLKVNATVSEGEIGLIDVGAEAEIIIRSSGQHIKGRVSEVSPSSGISGGRYPVTIAIEKTGDKNIYPGMHVTAAVALSEPGSTPASVFVPSEAVVQKDQLTGLYTMSAQNTALLRWVKTGRSIDGKTEILSGLNANESFISTAEGKLFDGAAVIAQ